MRILAISIFFAASITASSESKAEFPSDWGIIIEGTFIIPSSGLDWTDPEGRATGKRIGYLPTGTIVKVDKCQHVNGKPRAQGRQGLSGQYCDVVSNTGLAGKAYLPQIFPIHRGKIYAVAVDSVNEVSLHTRANVPRFYHTFSRNNGVIIEIEGDFQSKDPNSYINAVPTYETDEAGNPLPLSIKQTELVEKTIVVDFPATSARPTRFTRSLAADGSPYMAGKPVSLWRIKSVTRSTHKKLATEVSEYIGWKQNPIEEVSSLLESAFETLSTSLDRVLCIIDASTDVKVGLSFLGNSLQLSGRIPLAQKGKLLDFDTDVIERDNKPLFWTITAKTVACDLGATPLDSLPRAVESVSLYVINAGGPHQGVPPRLTQPLIKRYGLNVPHAVLSNNQVKLFEIAGYQNYDNASQMVSYSIDQTDLYFQLDQQEREILREMLIAKLAVFPR